MGDAYTYYIKFDVQMKLIEKATQCTIDFKPILKLAAEYNHDQFITTYTLEKRSHAQIAQKISDTIQEAESHCTKRELLERLKNTSNVFQDKDGLYIDGIKLSSSNNEAYLAYWDITHPVLSFLVNCEMTLDTTQTDFIENMSSVCSNEKLRERGKRIEECVKLLKNYIWN